MVLKSLPLTTFSTMSHEEEAEMERFRSFSRRLSRRRSSLADVVGDVNRVSDSFFRKFVNSTLSLVATMRKEKKRSVRILFCEVVGVL